MSLKNKLARLKGHMGIEQSENPIPVTQQNADDDIESISYKQKWADNFAETYWIENDYCFIREVRYPITYQHGLYTFEEAQKAVAEWNNVSFSHPLSAKGLNVQDMFFFDTETTGLGGGTGNTIFLLGYAYFDGDGVTVRQHILPRPGMEIPLYQSFLEKVNYNTLVTYNGKAFDWPQLKTRHTLIREHVPKLPDYGHFDLYHASRRLWKNELEKVKLINVEKNILGIERKDDIPGYLAPYIYFDYVERKDPEGLFGIMKHNEIDVLTLITLYIHLSKQLFQGTGSEKSSLEVARWYLGLGEKEKALRTYNQVLHGENKQERITALHALAFQWKRGNELEKALMAWEEVAENGFLKEKLEACIEMAKIFEHCYKQISNARRITETAISLLSDRGEINVAKSFESDLYHRLERICKKLDKAAFSS